MLLEQSQRAAAGELNDTEISGKKVWAGSLLLCQQPCDFCSLRACPLLTPACLPAPWTQFAKYNCVLRGLDSKVPFLRNQMIELCCAKTVYDAYM